MHINPIIYGADCWAPRRTSYGVVIASFSREKIELVVLVYKAVPSRLLSGTLSLNHHFHSLQANNIIFIAPRIPQECPMWLLNLVWGEEFGRNLGDKTWPSVLLQRPNSLTLGQPAGWTVRECKTLNETCRLGLVAHNCYFGCYHCFCYYCCPAVFIFQNPYIILIILFLANWAGL